MMTSTLLQLQVALLAASVLPHVRSESTVDSKYLRPPEPSPQDEQASPHELSVNPREGISVLYEQHNDEVGARRIVSDFPVSSLRHTDMNIDQPIGVDHVSLVVSSDCSPEEVPVWVSLRRGGTEVSITLDESLVDPNIQIDHTSFLEDEITFKAQWSYDGGCHQVWDQEVDGLDHNRLRRKLPQGKPQERQQSLRKLSTSSGVERVTWQSERVQMPPHLAADGVLGYGSTSRDDVVATAKATRAPNRAGGLVIQPVSTPVPTVSSAPSLMPSEAPSRDRTTSGTDHPTDKPTEPPTNEPTAFPTALPTAAPQEEPTSAPTGSPEKEPTSAPTDTPTESTEEEEEPTPKICRINVDVYHNGCRRTPFEVQAPAARVLDAVVKGQTSTSSTNEYQCSTIDATANVEFLPETVQVFDDTDTFTELPQLPQECQMWAYGRPFVDDLGRPLAASLVSGLTDAASCGVSSWIGKDQVEETLVLDTPVSCRNEEDDAHFIQSNYTQQLLQQPSFTATRLEQRALLGQEWANRALREHSSVASFAAFTIALMSNNAPPNLVQESLAAAQDEVRHAQVSFQAASLFLEQPEVQPGALPPSSHNFGADKTALALATAAEGCIHETLSALLIAAEVDQGGNNLFLEPPEQEWLLAQMTAIAQDEARHSALAWRTIGWICSVDAEGACQTVLDQVLNPTNLHRMGMQRFHQDKSLKERWRVEKAWFRLYSTLVPLAHAHQDTNLDADPCAGVFQEEAGTLLDLVSQRIVQNVCQHGTRWGLSQ